MSAKNGSGLVELNPLLSKDDPWTRVRVSKRGKESVFWNSTKAGNSMNAVGACVRRARTHRLPTKHQTLSRIDFFSLCYTNVTRAVVTYNRPILSPILYKLTIQLPTLPLSSQPQFHGVIPIIGNCSHWYLLVRFDTTQVLYAALAHTS